MIVKPMYVCIIRFNLILLYIDQQYLILEIPHKHKQQKQRINEEIMREREEEIRNIHKGMHTVNEIYKDLAHLVDNQQEGVDQIENQMENAKNNTSSGLKHIEKANEASSSQCVIS